MNIEGVKTVDVKPKKAIQNKKLYHLKRRKFMNMVISIKGNTRQRAIKFI